jgi:CheY-like chemotaxis protein
MARKNILSFSTRQDEDGSGPLVLVVDDEPDNRELAQVALVDQGYRVLTAPNADVALAIMRVIVPDVLFTDIIMPGEVNGLELAKTAKRLHPSIKVIITSGYDFMLRDASTRQFGKVLQKPYRVLQLVAEIEWALRA